MSLVQNLIDEKETEFGRLFWLSLLLFVGSFSIQIVNYAVTMQIEIPAAWKTWITDKCGAEELEDAF